MSNLYKRLYASDLFGAGVSLACAIHCAITPIFFLSKPLLDSAHHDHDHGHGHGHSHGPGIWGYLDWGFLVLSFIAVWYSSQHTSLKSVKYLLWISWLAFAAGIFLELQGIAHLEWLVYLGSLSLATIHLVNFRYCKIQNKKIATQS